MEPRYLVCTDQVAFDRLKSLASTEASGVYDVFPFPFDDGKVIVRLIPQSALAVKFIPLLLAVPGVTYICSAKGVGTILEAGLHALPKALQESLKDEATVEAFCNEMRKQLPHEGSF
jgi:hypothetical protein